MTSFGPLALLRHAIDFALPTRCPGCGAIVAEAHHFCPGCWRMLDFLAPPACACCGDPFAVDRGAGALCASCLADPPSFDGAAAAVAYGEIARRVALRLKHGRHTGLAETVGRAMLRLVDRAPEDALIVPVPLHRWRIWRRGYNQSALIARALARQCGRPLALDAVVRTRATPMLRGLGRRERALAVRGAFVVPAGQRAALRDRTVLLIDDVFTTGATAGACARALKRAGAREVRLVVWARVVRDADGR